MAELLRSTKEQSSFGLNELHTLTLTQMTALSQHLDSSLSSLTNRIALSEHSVLDLQHR